MLRRMKKRMAGRSVTSGQEQEKININLEKTLDVLKKAYAYPENSDLTIRHLTIGGSNQKAALIFILTITNTDLINEFILSPLMQNTHKNKPMEELVNIQSIEEHEYLHDAMLAINNGSAVLLVEGETRAYAFNVAQFEGRAVEQPDNESVVKGPNEAFSENVDSNLSLVRKRVRNENLIAEKRTVSKRSNNEVYVLYLKNLTNEQLLANVKERLHQLDTDAIQNLSILEQYIEDRKYSLFPSVLYTERPDRAATLIEDGYIVLLMDNSPACLVVPATFWSFFHTPEDHYLRLAYGNFTRLLRIFAMFITLFTSAIYIAVASYHIEMIPSDLLLAMAAAREKVPFSAFLEILLMELAFELIREAGIRVPTPIGPTIGIVGALILGQAAVEANIVSPIVVIVVALSGLSSFAIGDLSMNFAVRLIRFIFIFAAGFFGIYGMTAAFALGLFYLVSIESFGVPYLSPLTPGYPSSKGSIFRRTLQKEFLRPGYLKPKDMKKR